MLCDAFYPFDWPIKYHLAGGMNNLAATTKFSRTNQHLVFTSFAAAPKYRIMVKKLWTALDLCYRECYFTNFHHFIGCTYHESTVTVLSNYRSETVWVGLFIVGVTVSIVANFGKRFIFIQAHRTIKNTPILSWAITAITSVHWIGREACFWIAWDFKSNSSHHNIPRYASNSLNCWYKWRITPWTANNVTSLMQISFPVPWQILSWNLRIFSVKKTLNFFFQEV